MAGLNELSDNLSSIQAKPNTAMSPENLPSPHHSLTGADAAIANMHAQHQASLLLNNRNASQMAGRGVPNLQQQRLAEQYDNVMAGQPVGSGALPAQESRFPRQPPPNNRYQGSVPLEPSRDLSGANGLSFDQESERAFIPRGGGGVGAYGLGVDKSQFVEGTSRKGMNILRNPATGGIMLQGGGVPRTDKDTAKLMERRAALSQAYKDTRALRALDRNPQLANKPAVLDAIARSKIKTAAVAGSNGDPFSMTPNNQTPGNLPPNVRPVTSNDVPPSPALAFASQMAVPAALAAVGGAAGLAYVSPGSRAAMARAPGAIYRGMNQPLVNPMAGVKTTGKGTRPFVGSPYFTGTDVITNPANQAGFTGGPSGNPPRPYGSGVIEAPVTGLPQRTPPLLDAPTSPRLGFDPSVTNAQPPNVLGQQAPGGPSFTRGVPNQASVSPPVTAPSPTQAAPPSPPTPETPVPASEAVGNTKAAKKSRAKVSELTPNQVAERALSDQLKAEIRANGEPLPTGAAVGGTETTPPRLVNRVPESEVIDDVVNGRLKVTKTKGKSPIVVQEQQAAAREANPTPETQAAAVQKKLDSDGVPAAKRTGRKIAAVQKSLFGEEPKPAAVRKATPRLKSIMPGGNTLALMAQLGLPKLLSMLPGGGALPPQDNSTPNGIMEQNKANASRVGRELYKAIGGNAGLPPTPSEAKVQMYQQRGQEMMGMHPSDRRSYNMILNSPLIGMQGGLSVIDERRLNEILDRYRPPVSLRGRYSLPIPAGVNPGF